MDYTKTHYGSIGIFVFSAVDKCTRLRYNVGNSLCEPDKVDLALACMQKAKDKGVKFVLPVDTKIGKEFKPDTESKTVAWTDIPAEWEGFDIGEKTIEMFRKELNGAKTIVWNGPLGVFEFDNRERCIYIKRKPVHVACTGLVYEKDIFMRRKFSLFLGGPRSNFKRGKI